MENNNNNPGKSKTSALIKAQFLDFYKDKHLKKIAVTDIIAACNISRGTFYFLFEDVYDLYRKCERDVIDFLEDGLSDLILSTLRGDYDRHIDVLCKYMKAKYIEQNDMIKCFKASSAAVAVGFLQYFFKQFKFFCGK